MYLSLDFSSETIFQNLPILACLEPYVLTALRAVEMTYATAQLARQTKLDFEKSSDPLFYPVFVEERSSIKCHPKLDLGSSTHVVAVVGQALPDKAS